MKHKHGISVLATLLVAGIALLSSASAQGIQQDEFNGSIGGFWNYVDPLGGTTLSSTGTQAMISIPAGASRDPVSAEQGGIRSPRLIQAVAAPGADVGNFDIHAKFDGIQRKQYQIQGFLIIQDNLKYLRCEFYSDTNGIHAFMFKFGDNGQYLSSSDQIIADTGSSPLYLRLQRVDTVFTQYVSTNAGVSWVLVDTLRHQINVDSIAVFAASSDSVQVPRSPDVHAPAFDGLIDYFRIFGVVPVQLASFQAVLQSNNAVTLNWMTISETNNYGFYVQKSLGGDQNFQTISNSFVPGHGTTIDPQRYSYIDQQISQGNWYYRLKQIDLDGTEHYSDPVQVSTPTSVGTGNARPEKFALEQNYPNPFNPSTTIKYDVPHDSRVTLEVFNLIGQKVATLVDETKAAGSYKHTLDATRLGSGVYLYKLTAGATSLMRRMVLLK